MRNKIPWGLNLNIKNSLKCWSKIGGRDPSEGKTAKRKNFEIEFGLSKWVGKTGEAGQRREGLQKWRRSKKQAQR